MSRPTSTKQREATIRQARLLVAVREQPGQWTTKRAMSLHTDQGITPNRNLARKDLQALAQRGLLIEHGIPEQRHYTLNQAKASAL